MIKFYLLGGMVLLLSGLIYTGYATYTGLKTERDQYLQAYTLAEQNNISTQTVFSEYVVQASQQREASGKARAELDGKYREIQRQSANFERQLAKHDFQKLVLEKPGLIELRVNRAANRLFDELSQTISDNTPPDNQP